MLYKMTSSSPKGMKYFYRTINNKNVPEKFIVNKIGQKIMECIINR